LREIIEGIDMATTDPRVNVSAVFTAVIPNSFPLFQGIIAKIGNPGMI
jgi:hypothetical protein